MDFAGDTAVTADHSRPTLALLLTNRHPTTPHRGDFFAPQPISVNDSSAGFFLLFLFLFLFLSLPLSPLLLPLLFLPHSPAHTLARTP